MFFSLNRLLMSATDNMFYLFKQVGMLQIFILNKLNLQSTTATTKKNCIPFLDVIDHLCTC